MVFKAIGGLLGLNAPSTAPIERAAADAKKLLDKEYDASINRGQPYEAIGTGAVDMLGQRLGITGDPNSDMYGQLLGGYNVDQFAVDPSYQFRKDQGMEALQRSIAAQGGTLSPAANKALMEYGQGLASQEYGAAFDRNRATQSDIFDRLYNVAGQGQQQQQFQSALGQDYAMNVGDIGTSLGSAQVAAKDAGNARRSSFFNNLIGSAASVFGGRK